MLIKAFRLFVSSTFADFAAEREALQKDVFPALDAYCTAKGYQCYPIDLRWGVNEEAQLDQRTAEICVGEVRAAKQDYPPPNFLIMIGNRYGLVPLPYAIAQDEFDAILAWLESCGQPDAARALDGVYRYDDNHLAPRSLSVAQVHDALVGAYTLRSRVDELPELRRPEEWARREADLRSVLQEAADGLLTLNQINKAAHEKYFLSLTDQEIIHGLPGYRTQNEGLSSPTSSAAQSPPAIAFLRELVSEPGAPPDTIRQYFQLETCVEALKEEIRQALPANHIITSRVAVDQSGRLSETYLADFAARIQAKLKDVIDQYIARVEAIEGAPDYALTSERTAQRAFAERRLEIFVGREEALGAIASYLARSGEQPLVLHGRSGLGKSAVMARAMANAEPGRTPVVARFIGASAASSNLRALLISVIDDLAAHGIVNKPAEFEQDANKFNAQIEKLFSSIASPAVVFVDALDQLQRPHSLGWLPAKLPNALKLVISVLDDPAYESESDFYRDLRNRVAPDAFLEIEPLDLAQGREILSALQQRTRHRLQDSQQNYIIEKYGNAGGSPLYLRTAFEIARRWKSFQTAGTGRCMLVADTDGVIAQFIDELSSVQHHERELVARTLGYFAAAKDGLSAKELADILSRDAGVMRAISSEQFGARTDKLPPSVWVRLNRDLSPFLVEKQIDEQPLLQFFHRQVAQVARERHYDLCKNELHAALAAYFESQASEMDGKRVYAKRSLSELPYQLHRAENVPRLGEILMSPDWMQQKLAAFGPRPLIDDYQYARTKAQTLTCQALELAAGPLARDPRQLAAQIIGRMRPHLAEDRVEALAIDCLIRDARVLVIPPTLVPCWPHFAAPGGPEIRRFEGHTDWVSAVAFSPDGRHIISGSSDKTLRLWETASGREVRRFEYNRIVALSPNGRLFVSRSADKTLRLWEAPSGRELARFEGHTDLVTIAFSPDDRHIASGAGSSGDDNTVRLWDAASGREVRRFEGHTSWVEALAFSPDGRHIVSGSWDKTLRLWETASGREVRRFEGHDHRVISVAFSPDGLHIVSSSYDHTLRLWEAASGREVRLVGVPPARERIVGGVIINPQETAHAVAFSPDGRHIVSGTSVSNTLRLWEAASGREVCRLDGHTDQVNAVAFSPDGRHIASGSDDRTLRLWEVPSGDKLARFESHARWVTAVAFSPDDRHIVSSSVDKTLRLWETASGREVRRFEGHSTGVLAVAFSPDGRHIISGSGDKTLRLWEVASGREVRRFEGHMNVVNAVAFSPDGRYIVSGSDDCTLRLWEAASGRGIRHFEGSTKRAARRRERHRFGSVGAVAFSPDGRHIVSGSYAGTLRMWEAASGREVRRFEGHTDRVNAVAFSPDDRHIASGSGYSRDDNTLRLWEVASGRELVRFEGHSRWVKAAVFSPDGRHIVSGSWDKTLRLWEVEGECEIALFEGDSAFYCLAVARDGKRLAAGDAGGRVHLLDILVDEADKTIWLRDFAGGNRGFET